MKKVTAVLFAILASVVLSGCSDDGGIISNSVSTKLFSGLIFTHDEAYFSTDGIFEQPVDSNTAAVSADKIDIAFLTYRDAGDQPSPCFTDPNSLGKKGLIGKGYYYQPWLKNSRQIVFYTSKLDYKHFENAKSDGSLISEYFADSTVRVAKDLNFPDGVCIGGPSSRHGHTTFKKGQLYFFKNVKTQKLGMFLISVEQMFGWPYDAENKVDILIQN